MSVGERLARLRTAHGETLRQAAARTGVHYSTLARIERGDSVAATRRTLSKVAAGYGVSVESLQHGDGPADRLVTALAALPPLQRFELNMTIERRVRFGLRFVAGSSGAATRLTRIAAAAGLSPHRLSELLGPDPRPIAAELVQQLCAALVWEGGVNADWLRWGDLATAQGEGNPVSRLQDGVLRRLGERVKGLAGA